MADASADIAPDPDPYLFANTAPDAPADAFAHATANGSADAMANESANSADAADAIPDGCADDRTDTRADGIPNAANVVAYALSNAHGPATHVYKVRRAVRILQGAQGDWLPGVHSWDRCEASVERAFVCACGA